MSRIVLISLLAMLSVGCAAKSSETRLEEHTCLFALAEKACKHGVKRMKIIEREIDPDIALITCHGEDDRKATRYICD